MCYIFLILPNMIYIFSILVFISSFQIITSFKPHILIATKSLNAPFILQKQSITLQAVPKFYDIIRSRLIPGSTYSFTNAIFATFDPSSLLFALLFQKAYTSVCDSINMIFKNYQKEKSYKSIELLQSLLNFVKDRCGLLSKLLFLNYFIKIICNIFISIGFRIQSDFSSLLSRITYTFFFLYVLDLFKSQYMQIFFPSISDNRRQSYVINRSTSVMLWVFGGLMICEMVSTYLKVPLSSTLAFGGFSGLAIGLSARDIATNFIGGMILLFNEPFTPGDMVTFKAGNTEFEGRVERIGWAQTRIRGRDTRPTYIPNSHFIQIPITNMERITHRKFETTVPIRIQDYNKIPKVVNKIKERLRYVPKLDTLSMPFRISFTKIGPYYLEIEIYCYFATKSIDEYLMLQQAGNIEIIKAINDADAELALPMTQFQVLNSTIF